MNEVCEYFYMTPDEKQPSCHYVAKGPDDELPCGAKECEMEVQNDYLYE